MACRTVGRALLTALVVLLAGCGPGEPTGPFPPRPADIDTATVDLCSALTPDQLGALGVGPGEPGTAQLTDGPTRTCGWRNYDDGYNYTVQTLPDPAAAVVGSPGSTLDVVEGYGVVQVAEPEYPVPLCARYVDASDTNGLRIQVTLTGSARDGSNSRIDEVCDRTALLTAQALRNLRPVS